MSPSTSAGKRSEALRSGPAGARLARGLLPTLVAALAVATLPYAVPAAADAGPARTAPNALAPAVATPVRGAARSLDAPRRTASAKARTTGKAVPVTELTDEYSTTVANPDGTFTLHTAVTPQRVKQNGAWTGLDTTLVANPDGTFSPRASLHPVRLSGGAAGVPLLALENGSARLAYAWPGSLPRPRIAGNEAVYPGVYPGVDLRVTVDANGGAEDTLVIRDASAAANPALRHLRLGVRARGVTLRRDAAGTVQAVLADGKVAFSSGDARMWDSNHTAPPKGAADQPSTADGPGRGARVAHVGQTISATAADITPDPALLTGSGVKYPVFVDPAVVNSPTTAQHFNQLTQAEPGATATFDRAQPSGEGVGYQGGYYGGSTGGGAYASGDQCPCGIDRSDFQIGIPTTIWGATIQHAYLQATARFESDQYNHSATLSMYSTCALVAGQRWNVPPCIDASANPFYPAPVSTFDLHTPERTPPTNYPGQSIQIGNTNSSDWHVTAAMQKVADLHLSAWSVEIRGDESNAYNFIRIDQTAIDFVIQYDFPPDAPTALHSSPNPHNGDGSAPVSCMNNGWLGAADGNAVTLSDWVTSRVHTSTTLTNAVTLTDTTTGTVTKPTASTGLVPTGAQANATVTGLLDGHHYTWYPTVTSNALNGYAGLSTTGSTCAFTTDFDRPTNVGAASTDFPAAGAGYSHLAAGQAGTFTLSASDPAPSSGSASGLWCYGYAFDSHVSVPGNGSTCTPNPGTDSGVVLAGANGSAQISWTPAWGTHTLEVYAIDRAGNTAGQTQTYTFYAPENPKASPSPGDVTGDGVPDMLLPDSSGNLRVYQMSVDPASGGAIAAAAADAPPGSTNGWADPNLLVTHRGSMHGLFVDDLLVHLRGNPVLYIYRNDSTGHFSAGGRVVLTQPSCPGCGNGYPTDGSWANLVGLTALGDSDKGAVGDVLGSGIGSDPADFLATMTEGTKRHLWLFHQYSANSLSPTVILASNAATDSATSWTTPSFSPGDSTGDGLPDVWTRDGSGNLLRYASAKKADGTVDWTGIGGGHGTTTLTTGLTAAAYPVVSSAGDLTGDAQPDLWGTGTANGGQLLVWPGKAASPYFAAPVVVAGSSYSTSPASAPPVLTWLFGNFRYTDGSTDLVSSGGVLTDKDTSGGGNAGTLSAGVTAGQGHDGADVHLNGTSGVVTSAAKAVDTTAGFTVAAWVNATAGTTGTRTAVSQSGTSTSQFALQYDAGTGKWAFTVAGSDATGPAFTRSVATAAPAFGVWTHLTGVYDASAKTVQLYVNGAAQGSPVAYTAAWSATGSLLAGADRRNAATADFWNGDLDDVEVYARTLPAAEVAGLYNNQKALLLKPTATSTVPAPVNPATAGCSPTGPYGVVAPTAAYPVPALDVTVSDTDPTVTASADFALWDETAGQTTGPWNAGTRFGGAASHEYRFTPALTSGHRYAWYARTNDGSTTSPPSDVCHFTYSVPFGMWPGTATPSHVDSGDGGAIEVGVRFRVSQAAVVSGVAFYKSDANTGTHTGSLWTNTGQLVASGTFAGETAAGWQTLTFASPVFIPAGTTYVASYYTPNGHYSYDSGTFLTGGVSASDASGLQVTGLQYGVDGPNATFHYGSAGFPATDAGAANNYWVQPLVRLGLDNGPHVVSATPVGGNADPVYPGIEATFAAPIDPATVTFALSSPAGTMPGTATYDGSGVGFTPRGQLTPGTTYTASVRAADPAGNAMPSAYTWTFTVSSAAPDTWQCTYAPCGLWDNGVQPAVADFGDGSANELGTAFTTAAAAQVTGIAFYKSSANTGTHTGSLWRSDGTLLATGTFTGETDSGWQTLTFATPQPIVPGTTYIASYSAPNGHYAADVGYFTSPQTYYPITAPGAGNGVYRSGAGFPGNASSNQSNYWVQPLFTVS
ncbi:DUF4082 domain-containing protein [Hamadaea tsunoensis]|uniref:DUF4082 domain-containing protein n=1 Tax=Hamadaea tsunoensis TaxID=53368 RepID=UPI0003F7889E|nr:DUF4082 domain-containing protein [Hamadaea tsunoensis]